MGEENECPECGMSTTMKEGEMVVCWYCRSAIGIPGSALITGGLIGVALFIITVIGLAVFAG